MDEVPSTRDLLVQLNTYARTQMSTLYILKTGIIYGVGFVVGSTVIAAILINTSLLLFGEFPLVQTVVNLIQRP